MQFFLLLSIKLDWFGPFYVSVKMFSGHKIIAAPMSSPAIANTFVGGSLCYIGFLKFYYRLVVGSVFQLSPIDFIKALALGSRPKNVRSISASGTVAPFSKISLRYLIPVFVSITPFF